MNFMLQILQTVILASLVILALWLFDQGFGKRAGYRWRKIVWMVLCFRLLLPIPINIGNFTKIYRGIELTVNLPRQLVEETPAPVEALKQENAEQVSDKAESNYALLTDTGSASTPLEERTPISKGGKSGVVKSFSTTDWLFLLWAVGALSLAGFRGIQYHSIRKKYFKNTVFCQDMRVQEYNAAISKEMGIKKAVSVRIMEETRQAPQSPMLLGYFHTVLLLPGISYTDQELDAVLRHELTHYQKKDLWYKMILAAVCDIYWFNPVFRLMKNMAFRDVEYVCDEMATLKMTLSEKKDYSNTILKSMTQGSKNGFVFTTQFAGTKKNALKRFENIFTTPNKKIGISALCLILAVFVTGTACVSVKVEEEEPASAQQDTENVILVDERLLSEDGEALLEELEKNYPNTHITTTDRVNYQTVEDFDSSLTAYLADVITMHSLAEEGKITDITEYLEKKGWLEQMSEPIKEKMSDADGRIYGIPTSLYAFGLTVNVDLFQKAGLTDQYGVPIFPKTWEELAQEAMQIKEATGAAGFCLIARDYLGGLQFCNLAWNFGATELYTYDPDNGFQAQLNSDEAIAAMEFVRDLRWKYDVLTENPDKEDYYTGYEHLANGTAAMFIGANDTLSIPTGFGMNPDSLAMGAIPAGPGGEQHTCYGGTAMVFSADAAPEEIEMVLDVIETQGLGPVLNDASKKRISERIENEAALGVPVITEIPVWDSLSLQMYEQDALVEASNINPEFYRSYFDTILIPGNLKEEDEVCVSTLYEEICTVLTAVMKDPDADITALMEKANENWQKMIDLNN